MQNKDRLFETALQGCLRQRREAVGVTLVRLQMLDVEFVHIVHFCANLYMVQFKFESGLVCPFSTR